MISNDAGIVRLRATRISIAIFAIVPTGPATGAVPRGAMPLAGGRSR